MPTFVDRHTRALEALVSTAGRLFDESLVHREWAFLDIGCGIGGNLVVLRRNGIRSAFGFDLVAALVASASKGQGLENLAVANAASIPFKTGTLDVCLLYNVIEHCSRPKELLAEIRRVLRPGGLLYMDTPNGRSVGDRIFRWGGRLVYGRTSHVQSFTRRSIEALLADAGFEVSASRELFGIYVEYPQLGRFPWVKRSLRYLFDSEVAGWEYRLIRR
ncbi:MAG: class I SAM-dependent methyltransferase [Deltaproteobacteria bacterium]|nr:class I SAM-dependent methyltransferase [Deltaproteobacteria bacterium]